MHTPNSFLSRHKGNMQSDQEIGQFPIRKLARRFRLTIMAGTSVTLYNRHWKCGRERAFGGKGSFHGLCRDLTDEVGEHATLAFGAFVGIYMSLNWIRFRRARNAYEECNKNGSVHGNLSKISLYSRESSLYLYTGLITLHPIIVYLLSSFSCNNRSLELPISIPSSLFLFIVGLSPSFKVQLHASPASPTKVK
jgi:ribosomal protein S14